MKYLEDYVTPGDDELRGWTIEQAQAADARNKDIYWRNKTLVQNARAILLEAEPSNRTLVGIEAQMPPYQVARRLHQMRGDDAPPADKKR
jgi:hypothetical protein